MAARCNRDLAGQRDRALLLLLGAGLSRAEVVRLQAERLRFAEGGLTLPGRGGESVAVGREARHDLCPVRTLEEWLRASGTRYGPVFRKVTRWGTLEPRGLGTDAVRIILMRRGA
jgi:site-specific recombinase XerC